MMLYKIIFVMAQGGFFLGTLALVCHMASTHLSKSSLVFHLIFMAWVMDNGIHVV